MISDLIPKWLDVERFLLRIPRMFESGKIPGRRAEPAMTSPPVDLILHVNDVWITSEWARKNIERMLGRYAQSQVRLTVRDVAQDPRAAEEDQVVFTPTLVKRNPPPRAWLIGDLSDHDAVMSLLKMSGVGHRRSS